MPGSSSETAILERARPGLLASLGLACALYGQTMLDRWPNEPFDGVLLLTVASVLWFFGIRQLLRVPPADPVGGEDDVGERPVVGHRPMLWIGLALVGWSIIVAPALAESLPIARGLAILRYPDPAGTWPWRSNNALTTLGTLTWLAGTVLVVLALREPPVPSKAAWLARRLPRWRSSAWALLAIVAVAALFRFWDLPGLPREMTSDHTEKLLDIHDVLQGARPVFFQQNAGREPLQFYMTAIMIALGFPYGFLAEKAGMALVSLAAVPTVYLAGRELGGRRLGLAAAAVLALAPWHVQVARAAMRISWAPLFVALTLYVLLRALRTNARNHWLVLGAVLGAGMYGYTAFRPMALVVAAAVPLKLAHDAWHARGGAIPWAAGRRTLIHAGLAALVSVLVAAPLIRYAVDDWDSFNHRTASRMTDAEVALANPPLTQFRINMVRAVLMVNRTVDSGWIHSPPGRPGLETVGGALFVLGVLTALLMTVWAKDWRLGLVLVALPAMLLSSALALAFPGEVPHLGRAAGALPMVAVLAGLPLVVLPAVWERAFGVWAGRLAAVASLGLVLWMAFGAWPRVFVEYRNNYDGSTHNASEGVAVARQFLANGGSLDDVWIVGWPHGWDYRILGISLGDPKRENLLWDAATDGVESARKAAEHAADPDAKLYMVGGSGAARSVDTLREIYPDGRATHHEGHLPGKAFWSVYVPPRTEASP